MLVCLSLACCCDICYEDHLLNGVKILFHFFSRNVIGFYHHFHLVFCRKLLLRSLRIFHVRSCQYLKKTLNGLFICLTTFQHDVYIELHYNYDYSIFRKKLFLEGKSTLIFLWFILEGRVKLWFMHGLLMRLLKWHFII